MSSQAADYLVPLVVGLVVLLIVYALYLLIGLKGVREKFNSGGGFLRLGYLAEGADGRPSTSKFQFFVWTAVVLLAWVAIYVARLRRGEWNAVPDVPQNLLLVMGLSGVTMAAAKGVTVAYMQNWPRMKPSVKPPERSTAASLFQDDTGFPDLSKIQMLAWTLIATGTYAVLLWNRLGSIAVLPDITTCATGGACGLPDIDGALLVLMGLGQGAYIGKKLTVTGAATRLNSLGPSVGKAGDSVTIYGSSLGTSAGAYVTLDGTPLQQQPQGQAWTDRQITFQIPVSPPAGGEWTPPRQSVGVAVVTSDGTTVDGLALVVVSAGNPP
jgi:hypothetical protein